MVSGFQDDNSKGDEKNAKFETEQTRTLAAHQIHTGLLVPETSSKGDLSVQEMMAFSQKIQADLSREVGDRYRIIEPIAEGGMAVIFRAEQVQLGREVAIKLMKSPERIEDVQRFETEAAIAAKLAHPNIVRVYDFGRLTNGHMYLVMELVSGETLKSYVLRNGALEPSIGVDLMRQITEALVEIHQNQVVHRDIKPTNIVLIERPGGRLVAKLIDFGIVKDLQASSGDSFRNHGILGSPMYMSPEQISGANVDRRSDLYALGLTFFFVFSGRNPYLTKDIIAILNAQREEDLPSLATLDVKASQHSVLVWLIERLTQKDPINRFQSTLKVVEVLTAIQQGLEGGSTLGITSTAERRYLLPEESEISSKPFEKNSHIHEATGEQPQTIEGAVRSNQPIYDRRILLRLIGGLLLVLLFTSVWLLASQRSLVKAITEMDYTDSLTTVTLESLPSNAEVFEGGVLLGTTPFTIRLSESEYKTVTVELDGYEKVVIQISTKVPNPKVRLRQSEQKD